MNTDRQDQIAAHAHALWEAAGRPDGDADRFWFEAEQALQEKVVSSDATAASEEKLTSSKLGKAAKPV
ncbi:DUF2934 domain-containing protein [Loktanella sp. M215]|uniref:DUF2934 domain-containing protein n=1 Tax=Loktanella sp. M215 TaxID=2675431 RepID=UPI001F4201E1|nr:DUF2934 domain-containing protein [Loktanella sp. M215]MCF7701607.1 DUF2934 domain-containing protein [Loktanella sp. M215]